MKFEKKEVILTFNFTGLYFPWHGEKVEKDIFPHPLILKLWIRLLTLTRAVNGKLDCKNMSLMDGVHFPTGSSHYLGWFLPPHGLDKCMEESAN